MEIIKKEEGKGLTIEELRQYKGFEQYTDEEAEETIKTLEGLAVLFFNLYRNYSFQQKRVRLLKQESHEELNRAA